MTTPPTPTLDGLRIIELTDEKGVWAGKLLADMGANVIKIEPPSGDPTRSYTPFLDDEPGPERSLYFWHYNTSKRGITLDIETEQGRALFKRLVEGRMRWSRASGRDGWATWASTTRTCRSRTRG